jgi:hypothetical protein
MKFCIYISLFIIINIKRDILVKIKFKIIFFLKKVQSNELQYIIPVTFSIIYSIFSELNPFFC